ncbi:MFS transporter [Streptomyces goshikiensis]|uniref:MFS transporter n=1 Tax=Streptomyces goshikiensis TaxID=1942 RepID=UPI0033246690
MAQPTYRKILSASEFRGVVFSHMVSILGDLVTKVALPVLVYQRTDSSFLSAAAFAVGFLPQMASGLLFASVVDRYPPRTFLIACDVLRAALVLLMVVPGMPVAVLLLLLFVSAAVTPLYRGARLALVPAILGKEAQVLGRSLLISITQIAQVAGFGLGGALLLIITPTEALALDAATFLLSAGLLAITLTSRPASSAATPGRSAFADTRSLLRDMFSAPDLRAVLLLNWIPPVCTIAPVALAVAYTSEVGTSPSSAAVLMLAMPLGALLSEGVVSRFASPRLRDRMVIPVSWLAVAPLLGFGLQPGIPVAGVMMFLCGIGSAYSVGLFNFIINATSQAQLGGAMGVNNSVAMSSQGVGALVAGAVSALAPPSTVLLGAGVVGIVATALLGSRVRNALAGQELPA